MSAVHFKEVGSQPDPGGVGFPLRRNRLGYAPSPNKILIKALATLPPRLGMAEYGLGIGFKGKAFIKIVSLPCLHAAFFKGGEKQGV